MKSIPPSMIGNERVFADNNAEALEVADGIGQYLGATSFAVASDRAPDINPPTRDRMPGRKPLFYGGADGLTRPHYIVRGVTGSSAHGIAEAKRLDAQLERPFDASESWMKTDSGETTLRQTPLDAIEALLAHLNTQPGHHDG